MAIRGSFWARLRAKRNRPTFWKITIIESDTLGYQLGPDLAVVMGRPHRDLIHSNQNLSWAHWLPWNHRSEIISRKSSYRPDKRDGFVVRIDSLLVEAKPNRVDLIRKIMLNVKEGIDCIRYLR